MSAEFVEQAVLGVVLMGGADVLAELDLHPDEFQSQSHQEIYQTILELHEDRIAIDPVTVTEQLSAKKILNQVGGHGYISDLAQNSPTTTNAIAYATAVKDAALVRRLLRVNSQIVEMAQGEDSAEEKLAKAQALITSVQTGGESTEKGIDESMREFLGWLERKEPEMKSGFFDGFTGGIPVGLIALAAGTGQGKTAFALNIVKNLLDKSVNFYSYEMPASQLIARLQSNMSNVPYQRMRDQEMTSSDWNAVAASSRTLKAHGNLRITDKTLHIDQLCAHARRTKNRYGLDLIVVDYIQLVPSDGSSREREVANITRKLKGLSMDLDIPVIALSQLSREHEKRHNPKPRLRDLRESGAIEQDSDMVLFLYDESKYLDDSQWEGLTELYSEKYRHGENFRLFLKQELHCYRFAKHEGTAPASRKQKINLEAA